MQQQAQRFAAGLTPLPTAARVSRARGALRWRIISTVISFAILAAVWWFFGRDWSRSLTITIVVIWVVSSLFWLAVSVIALRNAKRDLGRIAEGVAFYLDSHGIEFVTPTAVRVPWADVTALKLAGRTMGAGHNLVVETAAGVAAQVPVSFLDATPAIIESAAQAYSLGRVRLDTSALDNLL